MRKRNLVLFVILLGAVLAAGVADSAVAPKVSYQGLLTNSGNPVTAPVTVVFTIYDAESGGAAQWTETRLVTPDASGRISVLLGESTPLSDAAFSSADRWLGVKVGADPEMSPRTQVATAPFSFRTGTLDGAKGGRVEGDLTVAADPEAAKDQLASSSRVILVGLSGDSIIYGPAEEVAFRAVDATGGARMDATVSGPGGAAFSIRQNGTQSAVHSATGSAYYASNAAKDDAAAMNKVMEVGPEGFVLYGADETDTLAFLDSAGRVTSTGVNVEASAVETAANKDASSTCAGGTNYYCGIFGNNCFGSGLNLVYARNSLAVGGCIQMGELGFPLVFGSTAIGKFHLIRASGALVVGDSCRVLEDGFNSVTFGFNNEINERNCFTVGLDNYVGSPQSVSMGRGNTLFGGGENYIFGDSSYLSDAGDCTIGGGLYDTLITAGACVIDGGKSNKVFNALFSSIGGGHRNLIDGSAGIDRSGITIGGGTDITASNDNVTVGGGAGHVASGRYSTIGGGNYCTASGYASFIGGGDQHTASGACAVVVGGGVPHTFAERNVASGGASFIGAGRRNVTSGEMSSIPGGLANEASGRYSFSSGRRAKAIHDGAFVWGDSTDSDVSSERENQFRVRADGGARFDDGAQWIDIRDDGTNLISTSAGGCLTLGGSWTNCSDVNQKENFRPVDADALLDKLAKLPITEWNYKTEGSAVRHIGPMAQDLHAAFGVGQDERHISTIDADGVALAAIQALHKQNQDLGARIADLEKLLERLTRESR